MISTAFYHCSTLNSFNRRAGESFSHDRVSILDKEPTSEMRSILAVVVNNGSEDAASGKLHWECGKLFGLHRVAPHLVNVTQRGASDRVVSHDR